MKKWLAISIGLVVGFYVIGWFVQQHPRPAIAIHGLFSMEEPPFWLQRLDHRQDVKERIQLAGGWDALKDDCSRLLQTNQSNNFFWYRGMTNQPALPAVIAALQPMFVEVYTPQIVDITLYGMGESGHRGVALYGLEIICGTLADPDEPKPHPNGTYRKMMDGVYEFYWGG
jgi:hypothetical protein